MTLVNITLDEEEQEVLLKQAEQLTPFLSVPEFSPWRSIAEKIRKAQDDSMFEVRVFIREDPEYYSYPTATEYGKR